MISDRKFRYIEGLLCTCRKSETSESQDLWLQEMAREIRKLRQELKENWC